jgi:hypothetical protein
MLGLLSLLLAPAGAGVTVQVDALEVDGLAVQSLRCELESGGLFASALVVGVLSQHKAELDACAPGGGAVQATWTWSQGKASAVEVPRGSPEGAGACVSRVLTTMDADLVGSCSALVLLGERPAAEKAAAELQAPAGQPAPD